MRLPKNFDLKKISRGGACRAPLLLMALLGR